jgi:hypothetical protein
VAHTRKDTLVAPPEWWKHLRPFNKRVVAKRERRAASQVIVTDREDQADATADQGSQAERVRALQALETRLG